MNLKNRFINSFAAISLALTMGEGIAAAQTTDSTDAVLNVTCPHTATVDVSTSGPFMLDTTVGAATYNATGVTFTIVTDLTCIWSDDFEVSAEIGTFNYDGTAPSGSEQSFGGEHLRLDNGSGSYVGPNTLFPWSGPPIVKTTVFAGINTSEPAAVENDSFLIFDAASPGVTTATWDGGLYLLPPNLAGGDYIAPLTVELTVN